MRRQTSRNKRDSGSGDLEGTQLSSTGASRASRRARARSWLHRECRRAGSILCAGVEALGMALCGAGSSRLSLAPALGAVCACRGAMEDGGSRGWRDPSLPGPLAAPRISTGNMHSPHGQPSATARGQRWPLLSLGSKGGAGAGKRIHSRGPPTPRLLSRTGVEVSMGNETRPARQGWVHPDTPESRDLPVPLSPSAPLVPSCARRVTDGVLSPHYVCLSKFNGL